MPSSDPAERRLVARAAAHYSWAYTPNRSARTAAAREAFLARFEDQVDPLHQLPVAERAKRAANARKAYFTRLALISARSRREGSIRSQALGDLHDATELLRSAFTSAADGLAVPPREWEATPSDVLSARSADDELGTAR